MTKTALLLAALALAGAAEGVTIDVAPGGKVSVVRRATDTKGDVTVLVDKSAVVTVGTPTPVPAPTPAPTPPPVVTPPAPLPTADFDTRKSGPGVVKWYDFDTLAQLGTTDLSKPWGIYAGQNGGPYIDTSVKASGAGSLRFDLVQLVNAGGNQAGGWYGNFSDDKSLQFTDGQEFYVQWRQRFSQAMIDTVFFEDGMLLSSPHEWLEMVDAAGVALRPTLINPTTVSIPSTTAWQAWSGDGIRFRDAAGNFIGYGIVLQPAAIVGAASQIQFVLTQGTTAGAAGIAKGREQGGIKQMNLVVGDGWMGRQWATCEGNEIAITTFAQYRIPQAYNGCGRFMGLASGNQIQNGVGCDWRAVGTVANGKFNVAPPCVPWVANEWMTFQTRVKVGTFNATTQRSDGSEYQLWIAREGQPSVLVIDYRPGVAGYLPLFTGDNGLQLGNMPFGKVNLFPWLTSKDATQPHPLAQTWYDELIISRQRIPDPK